LVFSLKPTFAVAFYRSYIQSFKTTNSHSRLKCLNKLYDVESTFPTLIYYNYIETKCINLFSRWNIFLIVIMSYLDCTLLVNIKTINLVATLSVLFAIINTNKILQSYVYYDSDAEVMSCFTLPS